VKQNNSRKEENEDDFDTWVDIHAPHCAFIKLCEFGSNENVEISYKTYSCGTSKRHLFI